MTKCTKNQAKSSAKQSIPQYLNIPYREYRRLGIDSATMELGGILRYRTKQGEHGYVLGVSELAKDLNWSRRDTVYAHLKILEKHDVIEIESNGRGKPATIRYIEDSEKWTEKPDWDEGTKHVRKPDNSTCPKTGQLDVRKPDNLVTEMSENRTTTHTIDKKDVKKENIYKAPAADRQTDLVEFDSSMLTEERVFNADSTDMASLWYNRILKTQPNYRYDYSVQERAVTALQEQGFSNMDLLKVFAYQSMDILQKYPKNWKPSDLIINTKDGTSRFQYVLAEAEKSEYFQKVFNRSLRREKIKRDKDNRQASCPF